MSYQVIGLLVLGALSNVTASLSLKRFSVTSHGGLNAILSPNVLMFLLSALAFYGVSFLIYATILRSIPVNRAYAMLTIASQIGMIIGGALVFGERLNALAWMGFLMISSGMVVLALSVE